MIDILKDGIYTENVEIIQELSKRIVGGALKAARAYVPTRENSEGKRVHGDVALYNGTIYVGTDQSICTSTIELNMVEMCKKKSPLRSVLEDKQDFICAALNYGVAAPWLKLHEKNIRSARLSANGIHLIAIPNIVELNIISTLSNSTYAQSIKETLEDRVLEEYLIAGPHILPELPSGIIVVSISEDGVELNESFNIGGTSSQMRINSSMFPKAKDRFISAYNDPLGDRIIKVSSDTGDTIVNQYIRVLQI